jgi:hypothetical protein
VNLYLISQEVNNSYDSYDGAVVAAPDEETARRIRPETPYPGCEPCIWIDGEKNINLLRHLGTWVDHPRHVAVKMIGVASDDVLLGTVLASFNAG